jgi:arginyl-tRNA synthetase
LGRAYALGATKYKEDEAVQLEIKTINKKVYDRTDESINVLYDAGRTISLQYFERLYEILDTKFDSYFFESETGPRGKSLVEANPHIFIESEGARIFPGEEYGLHTRVFINKEGLPTYEAKELALGKLKADRLGDYDWSVISTASEVNEYFRVLLTAMSLVYPELAAKTEHIGHGMVRLASGKMSSRTGQVIPALEFIKEVADAAFAKMSESARHEPSRELAQVVAIAAIKYSTLRGNIQQNSVFDKDQALSFEGDSGPYLQYSHARICSVLEKATDLGLVPSTAVTPDQSYELERVVYQFEEVVETAFLERAPHKVTTYLTELAAAFNRFYAEEKLADTTDQYAPYKLALATAVKQTLRNGLWVLGIKAPERM